MPPLDGALRPRGVEAANTRSAAFRIKRLTPIAPHADTTARNNEPFACAYRNASSIGSPDSKTQRCRCSSPSLESTESSKVERPGHSNEISLKIQVLTAINEVSQKEWDHVATSSGEVNPCLLWSFLNALEKSQSAVGAAGWLAQHVTVRDQQDRLVGVCPLYMKGHSYGEYVFDHTWAHYSHSLGDRYYPKLQSCVPFTPVTGPRLIVLPGPNQATFRKALSEALISIADTLQVSSLHVTFNTAEEWSSLIKSGYLQRTGIQYHWQNKGYQSFDDFLADLRQPKRKCIRQVSMFAANVANAWQTERKAIIDQGLRVRRIKGREVSAKQWDTFYKFYLSTVDRKWGSAYLTRDFFHMLGDMGDHVMLVVAETMDDETMVAGALNLVGSHTLYGRNWGCKPGAFYKHLHFELCYYQAIEEAISRGLSRVEAGAQGEHKMQRGYLPALTYSSHYIRDPRLRHVIDKYLDRERQQVNISWAIYDHSVDLIEKDLLDVN